MQSDPFLHDTIDHLGWPNRLRLVWRLFQDGRVSPWAKRLIPLGALAYFVMPFDVIPDFFLGVGQVDDLGVFAVFAFVLMNLLVKVAPAAVVAEHLAAMGVRPQPAASQRGHGPYVDAKFRRK